MRLVTLAAAAALTLVSISSAFAADKLHGPLSLQGYGAPPLAKAMHNWTGFYVGANGGYGWGSFEEFSNFFGNTIDAGSSGTGYVVGAQLGYNWQFAPRWVLGLETDFDFASLKGSRDVPWCASCAGSTTTESRLEWLGTTRARLGYLATSDLLLYGTGGVAYGQVEAVASDHCVGCSYVSTSKQWEVGWTAGAGLEWALADSWSVKAEYLHVELAGQRSSVNYGGGVLGWTDQSLKADIVRAGINYRF